MKSILLGALMVLLAAVVVNKKTWKHTTFLMLVVGILVLLLTVSLFGKAETFQGQPTCTTSSFPVDGSAFGNLAANFEQILQNSSNANTITKDGNNVGNLIELYSVSQTPSIGGGIPTNFTNGMDGIQKYRVISDLANYLFTSNQTDCLISFLTWLIGCNTFVLQPNAESNRYAALNIKGNVGTLSTSTTNLDRLYNYICFVHQISNMKLRSRGITSFTHPIRNTLIDVIYASNNVGQLDRIPGVNILLFRNLIHLYYGLFERTKPASGTVYNNEYVYWFGYWLARAGLMSNGNANSGTDYTNTICWYFRSSFSNVMYRYFHAANFLHYANIMNGYKYSTTINPLVGADIVYGTNEILFNLTGCTQVADTAPVVPRNVQSNTKFDQEFRIPGFLWSASNPDTTVINDHIVCLGHIFYLLWTIRKCYGTTSMWGTNRYYAYLDANENITISPSFAGSNANTNTANVFIANIIKPFLNLVVSNIEAHKRIEAAASTSTLTAQQLDNLMCNYLGDDQCIQPLTLSKILNIINNREQYPQYPINTRNPNAITSFLTGDVTTLKGIGNQLRKAIFKSNLDQNNNTQWTVSSKTKVTGSPIPGTFNDLTTPTLDSAIDQLDHTAMLNYVCGSTFGNVPTGLESYFQTIRMGRETGRNTNGASTYVSEILSTATGMDYPIMSTSLSDLNTWMTRPGTWSWGINPEVDPRQNLYSATSFTTVGTNITGPGPFLTASPTNPIYVEYVCVGGGGGGGAGGKTGGGGGGAGGRVITGIYTVTNSSDSFSIDIGAGGAGGIWNGTTATAGGTGSQSVIRFGTTIVSTAVGAGGGGGATGTGAAGAGQGAAVATAGAGGVANGSGGSGGGAGGGGTAGGTGSGIGSKAGGASISHFVQTSQGNTFYSPGGASGAGGTATTVGINATLPGGGGGGGAGGGANGGTGFSGYVVLKYLTPS